MLVKKIFGDRSSRNKKRKWKLKHLHDDLHAETSSNERYDFLKENKGVQTLNKKNIYTSIV